MDPITVDTPDVYSVLHPTDFSEASRIAFAHALRVTLAVKGRIDILHVDTKDQTDWDDFPGVREMLQDWNLIPVGSDRQAVIDLGIHVHKAIIERSNPVRGTLDYLQKHPADLIVLAVHQSNGRMSWFKRSVGEPIGRGSGQAVLYLPEGQAGFVSSVDGSLSLDRIVIPVCDKPNPQPAIDALADFIRSMRLPSGRVTVLHVGDELSMPQITIPVDTPWDWELQVVSGETIGSIVDCASRTSAGLIAMATDGRDGFLDGLRGSHSERVLRHAHCPVLVIPEGSRWNQTAS